MTSNNKVVSLSRKKEETPEKIWTVFLQNKFSKQVYAVLSIDSEGMDLSFSDDPSCIKLITEVEAEEIVEYLYENGDDFIIPYTELKTNTEGEFDTKFVAYHKGKVEFEW